MPSRFKRSDISEGYYSQKEEQFRNTETVPMSTEKEQLDTKPQYSEIWYS